MAGIDHHVTLPAGSSLDLAMILDVAERSNRAHRALGTRLVGLEPNGVVLGIDRLDTAVPGAAEWPNGVITSLLDHACAIAALMTLDDPDRFAGSVGLRVEYLHPGRAGSPLLVRAECVHCTDAVALVHAEAFHEDEPAAVVALGRGTIAVSDVERR
jgi:acyl-coenzyme A thioesterase PaaI-like protein